MSVVASCCVSLGLGLVCGTGASDAITRAFYFFIPVRTFAQ